MQSRFKNEEANLHVIKKETEQLKMKRDQLQREVEQIERITNKTFGVNTDDIDNIINEKIDVWDELKKALPD